MNSLAGSVPLLPSLFTITRSIVACSIIACSVTACSSSQQTRQASVVQDTVHTATPIPAEPKAEWTLAQGSYHEKAFLARYRTGVPAGVTTAGYPHAHIVTWVFKPLDESGLPTPETNDAMTALDEAFAYLEAQGNGYLTAVATWDGKRFWQYYSRDSVETERLLAAALAARPPMPIEIAVNNDPEWSQYARLKSAAERQESILPPEDASGG